MKVFLNPHCDYGKGLQKWEKIENELSPLLGKFDVEKILSPEGFISQAGKALKEGESVFIAAGGDGTVNLLLNALMTLSDQAQKVIIGAVGLGSSNDFHKPFRQEAFIKGMPVKIDFANAVLCDVIRVSYRDASGKTVSRFCLNNASIGVTAEANAIYNSHIPLIKFVQGISIEAAIITAALKAIFTHRNLLCTLTINGKERRSTLVTNLGIIKNPHFAGGMRYDTHIKKDDGKLGVNLCDNMTPFETVRTLVALYQGRFCGLPKTRTWVADQLSVESARAEPFALEMDGEVTKAKFAEFCVIPKGIKCCQ